MVARIQLHQTISEQRLQLDDLVMVLNSNLRIHETVLTEERKTSFAHGDHFQLIGDQNALSVLSLHVHDALVEIRTGGISMHPSVFAWDLLMRQVCVTTHHIASIHVHWRPSLDGVKVVHIIMLICIFMVVVMLLPQKINTTLAFLD